MATGGRRWYTSKKGGWVVDNPTGSDQLSESIHTRPQQRRQPPPITPKLVRTSTRKVDSPYQERFQHLDVSMHTWPQQVDLPVQERFQHLDVFKEPLCLVSNDSDMNLQIVEEVLQQISQIDVPVSVIGVCGIYRSGKSYLMNKLYGQTKGFDLGSTIQSKTKGIWVWCKPHPTTPGHVLVLLDTEGLGDAEKRDEHHDTKIFCLTMLMSSVLIYNVKGVIDQDALKELSFITQVTKTVSVSDSTDDEDEKALLKYVSPHFVLCLRDFFSDLVDEGELTSDEYMEMCLRESPNKGDEEYNSIRRCIKTFFPRRKCFVLAQPAMNKTLKTLETLPEEQLDEDFKEGIQKMRTFVHDSGTKRLDNVTRKECNGKIFEMFMRIYIRAISEGKKMEYISAMEGVSMVQNQKLCDDVCEQYRKVLDKLQLMSQPSKKKLSEELWEISVTLLRQFRQDAYPYRVVWYEDQCMEKMNSMKTDVLQKHSCEVQKLCHEYLKVERKTMVENNTERYKNVQEYIHDFKNLIKTYHKKFDTFDEDERNVVILAVLEESHDEVLEMERKAEILRKIALEKEMDSQRTKHAKENEEKEKLMKQMEEVMKAFEKEKDLQNTKLAEEKEENERRIQEMAAEMLALKHEKELRKRNSLLYDIEIDAYEQKVKQMEEKMEGLKNDHRKKKDVFCEKTAGISDEMFEDF